MKETKLNMIFLINGPIPIPKAKFDTKFHFNIFLQYFVCCELFRNLENAVIILNINEMNPNLVVFYFGSYLTHAENYS